MKENSAEVTLMLIDDDDIDAMALQRSFGRQKLGNRIIRAHDGQEAFEMLEAGMVPYPFIILLDLQMPRMTGIEFLGKLRTHAKFHDSIVFVLTTSKAEQDLDASYDQNIAGYFVKEEAGENFVDVVTTLDCYWKVVHFPSKKI